ncbi:MAG: hypothetical protein AAGF93_04100 [Cyanobacteria bacterium P01_H01_bin.105]
MDELHNQEAKVVIDANDETLVTDLYQKVEQLSLQQKAALAQYLLSTNELTVVVSSGATLDSAIQHMTHADLGNMLESIAEQVRRLDESSLDLGQ